jgi:hypothetical protein
VVESPEHEKREISQYVVGQLREEIVSLEKVKTEGVFGTQYDVWDVRTAGKGRWGRREVNRWWVITNHTNFYPFDKFPSIDFLLSFHIGLMFRISERERKGRIEEHPPKFKQSWRRFGQAVDRFNLAKEAEEFQAVGNDLRECLLAFARDHADPALLIKGEIEPQLGNFKEWSRLIVRGISDGGQREYLQKLANITWDRVANLLHDQNCARFDVEVSLDAVSHFLHAVRLAFVGHERGDPARCPQCRSYQLASDYRPGEELFYTVCAKCGWEKLDEEENNRPRPTKEQIEAYLNREFEGPCTFPPPNL